MNSLTTQEQTMSIEQMCIDAKKRLAARINRSAGQHLRAMRLATLPLSAKKAAAQ